MEMANLKEFVDKLSPNLTSLMKKFEELGFEIRIVGGAVRDLMMGEVPRDIDLATNAQPTEIMFIVNEEFKDLHAMTAWGIRHGTVVVAFSELEQYEVSSLDFRIEKKGKKIVVSQKADWKEDAFDRDFTVNTMSVDLDGKVYDYMKAKQDIKDQKIKFVHDKDIAKELQRDPVLILRFFKLVAKFSDPKYDEKILDTISGNLSALKKVRSDTIKWFIASIRMQKFGQRAFSLMNDVGLSVESFVESTLNAYLKKIY
jgi:tRNA nucleotidyltransferase/poly(A) polymerase